MCGSPASRGLPLAVRLPDAAQALLPSNCGRPPAPVQWQYKVPELGEGGEVLPVAGAQGTADYTVRVPVEIEDLEVIRAQAVAHVAHQGLGTQRSGEAVGHVAGDAQGVGDGEGARLDAQQVEFHR